MTKRDNRRALFTPCNRHRAKAVNKNFYLLLITEIVIISEHSSGLIFARNRRKTAHFATLTGTFNTKIGAQQPPLSFIQLETKCDNSSLSL